LLNFIKLVKKIILSPARSKESFLFETNDKQNMCLSLENS